MKSLRLSPLVLLAFIAPAGPARGSSPEIAKLLFGPALETAPTTPSEDRPAWVLGVEQKGGQFVETPPA